MARRKDSPQKAAMREIWRASERTQPVKPACFGQVLLTCPKTPV